MAMPTTPPEGLVEALMGMEEEKRCEIIKHLPFDFGKIFPNCKEVSPE